MTDKCNCYRTRKKQRYVYSRETGQVVDSVEDTVGYCIGTKECDECGCGGDMSKCNFYPEVRERADKKQKNTDKDRNIADLEAENKRLKKKLDAAVADLVSLGDENSLCCICQYFCADNRALVCADCKGLPYVITDGFKWRGED